MSQEFTKGFLPETVHHWALYVDIEGFGYLYDKHKMLPMSLLTSDVFALLNSGRKDFFGLSAVQYGGDGFLIMQMGSIYDGDIRRPLAFGCALMKRALLHGYTFRSQLSMGDSGDILSTYSEYMKEVIQNQNASGYLAFKNNDSSAFSNMIYNPVIGTGILNAYRLHKPKGPLFVIDAKLEKDLVNAKVEVAHRDEVLCLDWLRHEDEFVLTALDVLQFDNR